MGAKLCEAFCRVSVCDTCFDKIYVWFLVAFVRILMLGYRGR